MKKFTPAILTLLVFMLAQGFGTLLLFGFGMLISPEFNAAIRAFASGAAQSMPAFELMPVSAFSLILIVTDIIAVLICYFFLHNIRLLTQSDIASIKLQPAMLAIAGGILAAFSTSILTEDVALPDIMQEMALAMSHNFWGLLAIAIIGPIAEEFLFREAIEGEMLRRGANPWTAILVSAIAFGIVHFNLAQCLYALPLGIIFGIIYYKTGNILLTALLHIINNGLAALQMYLLGENIADISYADLLGGDTAASVIMALCAIFSVLLMALFWDKYPSNAKQQKRPSLNGKSLFIALILLN